MRLERRVTLGIARLEIMLEDAFYQVKPQGSEFYKSNRVRRSFAFRAPYLIPPWASQKRHWGGGGEK